MLCIFPERSGYHLALAKMDSAPSASVGHHGVSTALCGPTSGIHFANSEASLLKIHHSRPDSAAASIMVSCTKKVDGTTSEYRL